MTNLRGFDILEIDDVAHDLLHFLAEMGLPPKLTVLGLCRAITILSSDEDLDHACRLIDELSEIDYTASDFDDIGWEDEDEL
jgi:hypothetical protein